MSKRNMQMGGGGGCMMAQIQKLQADMLKTQEERIVNQPVLKLRYRDVVMDRFFYDSYSPHKIRSSLSLGWREVIDGLQRQESFVHL